MCMCSRSTRKEWRGGGRIVSQSNKRRTITCVEWNRAGGLARTQRENMFERSVRACAS